MLALSQWYSHAVVLVCCGAQEANAEVAATLRKARMDSKLWGRREKRAKEKREGKSGKKKAKNEEGV